MLIKIISVTFCYLLSSVLEHKCEDELKPLILSPLVKEGKIEEAQNLAAVKIGGVESYSGYFTVNEDCGNNLFFWFIGVEEKGTDAPVVLWLNGGPGVSSMVGLFDENGPWNYDKTGFVKRKYAWTSRFNMVYFDQPVDSGYSFTERECYAQNLTALAQDLTSALFQFFKMFPKLQKEKFFITGESYAGHYIPAVAVEIDKQNADAEEKINLKGIIVGNPSIDPMCVYTADFLFNLGIIDNNGLNKTKDYFKEYVRALSLKNYTKAAELDWNGYGGDFLARSGIPSQYNVLYVTETTLSVHYYEIFLRDYYTRKLLHVGFTPFNLASGPAYTAIISDSYTSNGGDIEYLLNTSKYIVGFYSGHLDLRCLYLSLSCSLRRLHWTGSKEFLVAQRTPWFVSGRLAGWYKTVGNLFEVVFRDSGHLVPSDQPEAALQLISAVVKDEPGEKLLTALKNGR